jgi:PAS domain S-box-containing protein
MKDADTIFEHTQDALFLVNVANDETFTIQTINRAYEELTSLSRETLRNKTPRELLGDDQGAAVEARYQECVQKQAPIEYDEQLTIGGEMKYWHTRLTPIIEEDIVVQLVGATRDITDRHQHNQQLERERDRFQAVFDDAFDAMVIADDDGQYLEVNESVTELFGLSKDELVGQSVKDFAPEEFDFEEAWQEFQDSERGRDTFPLVRPDGTERLVEYAASTNIVPGQTCRFFVMSPSERSVRKSFWKNVHLSSKP